MKRIYLDIPESTSWVVVQAYQPDGSCKTLEPKAVVPKPLPPHPPTSSAIVKVERNTIQRIPEPRPIAQQLPPVATSPVFWFQVEAVTRVLEPLVLIGVLGFVLLSVTRLDPAKLPTTIQLNWSQNDVAQ
jgi:hypothetical protein